MIEGAEWAKEGTYLREKIEQYQLDKVDRPRPHLAADLRRHRARSDAAAHAERNAGAAGRASVASERLVARHGAAAARPEAGQSVVPALQTMRADVEEPARRDSTRCGRSRGWARSTRALDARGAAAIRIRGCGFRRCAPAKRSTKPATGRSRPIIARLSTDRTSTSSSRRC